MHPVFGHFVTAWAFFEEIQIGGHFSGGRFQDVKIIIDQ